LPVFAGLMAVLPAAFALWSGRRIAAFADDPAIAERLLANRTRGGVITGFCGAILVTTAVHQLAWALPLLIVTRMAAGYTLRKELYRESWSLAAYLFFFVRLVFAVFGYSLLLAMTPSLVRLAGSREWILAGVLALVLVAWNEAYAAVFRVVLRTRPLDDGVLVGRFTRMLKDRGLPAVRLEQVDMRGGVYANAVALPSPRQSAVVVTSTLVQRLDHDEATAVLAHELAHIEHYNPRRLGRASVLGYMLIAASALLSPIVRLTVPNALTSMQTVWPIVLFAVMALRAQQRQAHETASDLHALALTHDADALIRALSKLHAWARVPRRWDTEFERHATHPSLARRIQAIHAAAGTAPALLGEAATFSGMDDASAVTFFDNRLVWSESETTHHTIGYGQLTMLRVDARPSGATRLLAVDSGGRRWEIALQPADVARAQATLDIVDTRLAAAAAPPVISASASRALALIAVLFALAIGQLPVSLVAAMAFAWPALSLTAAAGAASVGGAALMLREHSLLMNDSQGWTALALLACGLGLLAVSIANRREPTPAIASKLAGLLAVAAFLAWCAIALSGVDAIDLHQAARAWPSAAILTLALAGAFAFERGRAVRRASAPVALAGCLAVFLGSTTFLDRFVKDPFLAPAGAVTVRTLAGASLADVPVPFEVAELWLSPAGRYMALSSESPDEETTIHAGRVGGALSTFTANDAAFVDEGRLLLFEQHPTGSTLRTVHLDAKSGSGWSLQVPVRDARLSFDRVSRQWCLLGWNADGDIVSAAGRVGEQAVLEKLWKAPADDTDAVEAISSSRSEVLTLESQSRPSMFGAGPFQRWASIVQTGLHTESHIWTTSDHGRSAVTASRLDLRCRRLSTDGEAAVCTAFDGTRTRFFEVNSLTRTLKALASVAGHFYLRGDAGGGWVAGWWDGEPVLLRTATRSAIRVRGLDGSRVDELAITETVIGAVSSTADGSIVRLYKLN